MHRLLEINDTQLSLFEGTQLRYQQPAVALWQSGELVFGHDALSQARLHPQQINNLFLDRMSDEPLPRSLGTAHNHADLLYQQLQQLTAIIDHEPVTLVVPANLTPQQLGALLGIAQEAGLHIAQFVDASLLYSIHALTKGQLEQDALWLLDVQLHNLTLTQVNCGEQLQRDRFETLPGTGLVGLLEGWLNVVADQFITATRFDPLHAAITEQQVYNQLYAWLSSQQQTTDIGIEVSQKDEIRRVDVPAHLLRDKTSARAANLAERLPPASTVALTARAAALPGLTELVDQHRVQILPATALPEAYAWLEQKQLLPEVEGVGFVTQLQVPATLYASAESGPLDSSRALAEPVGSATSAALPNTHIPTHGLSNHQALPIEQLIAPLAFRLVGNQPSILPGYDLILNDQPLEAQQPLRCGDVLTVGPQNYLLIRVNPSSTRDSTS